jgi:hypothetical protein
MLFLSALVALTTAKSALAQTQALAEPCKAYFAIEPLPADVVKLLATPVVVSNSQGFADASFRQLQEWDLPSKVTAWRDRPSADELARQWDEFNQKWNRAGKSQDNPPHFSPYLAQPLPPWEWKEVESWFAKEGPKKLRGLCVDAGKATYRLAIGMISGGGASAHGSSNPHEYEQLSQVRAQDNAVGPNAGTFNPTAHESRHDELNGMGGSVGPSAHTCVYLYRTVGAGGSAPPQPPEIYYCHSGSGMPRSVLTTMLKYLAKTGMP